MADELSESGPTPIVDAFMGHLNLPDGRKIGIPVEFVDLARALERHCEAMANDLFIAQASGVCLRALAAYEAFKREQLKG